MERVQCDEYGRARDRVGSEQCAALVFVVNHVLYACVLLASVLQPLAEQEKKSHRGIALELHHAAS